MLASTQFDEDAMLDRAWDAFLKRGLLGTSMNELAEAVGSAPDLISATYGSTEQLFVRAFEHRAQRFIGQVNQVLDNPDAREAVRAFVELIAYGEGDSPVIVNCLPTQAASETDLNASHVRRSVADLFQTLEFSLELRLGRLDAAVHPKMAPALASKLIISVAQGAAALACVQDDRTASQCTTNALLDALFAS
jgi:TetR/AcrR family transcriptional repressor of nem operon